MALSTQQIKMMDLIFDLGNNDLRVELSDSQIFCENVLSYMVVKFPELFPDHTDLHFPIYQDKAITLVIDSMYSNTEEVLADCLDGLGTHIVCRKETIEDNYYMLKEQLGKLGITCFREDDQVEVIQSTLKTMGLTTTTSNKFTQKPNTLKLVFNWNNFIIEADYGDINGACITDLVNRSIADYREMLKEKGINHCDQDSGVLVLDYTLNGNSESIDDWTLSEFIENYIHPLNGCLK